jgi:hypothetical protein
VKVFRLRQGRDKLFELWILREGNGLSALPAGCMVVVFVESVTELKAIFPTGLQPLNNADLFKQGNHTVHTGSIDAARTCDDLLHGEWFFALQGLEDGLPCCRDALVVRPQSLDEHIGT